ncbi:MFS transporter [Alteribacter natronophilus]|uniref:MFS transporter n=1 Tax=Alteribacter natronophilus TaxID=2583810 RepID=UPI00110DD44E|nr:MFS transporter [Alteribacter natronophilus]TMW73819.1 MFS transporter [Alteribacter natronophilus]
MNRREKIIVFMLGLLPFLMVIGNSMFIPLLPTMEVDLNITTVQSGLILTVFSVPAALAIPFMGIISDRVGRKKTVLWSLAIIAFGSAVCAIAVLFYGPAAYAWLLAGRFIQGIGAGGTASLAMAFIGDQFTGQKRSTALGAMEVFNGLGKALSPLLGAAAALILWTGTFWIYLVLALLALLGIGRYIPGSVLQKPQMSIPVYLRTVGEAVRREGRWLIPVMVAGGTALFVLFGLLVYLSYEIERVYGFGGAVKGVIIAIPLTVFTIASYYAGKKTGSDAGRIRTFLTLGFLLILAPLSAALVWHTFYLTLIYMITLAAGIGFLLPCCNLLVTFAVSSSERGMVVSFYHTVRFLGVAFGPVVYSAWMFDEWGMYARSLVLVAGAAVWLRFTITGTDPVTEEA